MTCQHSQTQVVPMPSGPHHAKEVCVICGAFLRWLKKPETVEREKRNAENLARLKTYPLTEWEKGFLLSLEKQGRGFSPKQQARLNAIAERNGL